MPETDESVRDEIADLLSEDDDYEIVPKGDETATDQAKDDDPTGDDKPTKKSKGDDDRENDPEYLRQQWQQDRANYRKAKEALAAKDSQLEDLTKRLEAAEGSASKVEQLQQELEALKTRDDDEDDDADSDANDFIDPDAHKRLKKLEKQYEADKKALADKLDKAISKLTEQEEAQKAAEADLEEEAKLKQEFTKVYDDCDEEFGDEFRSAARTATIKHMRDCGLDPVKDRKAFVAAAKATIRDKYEALKLKKDLAEAKKSQTRDEPEDLGPGIFGTTRPSRGSDKIKAGSHEAVMEEMRNHPI